MKPLQSPSQAVYLVPQLGQCNHSAVSCLPPQCTQNLPATGLDPSSGAWTASWRTTGEKARSTASRCLRFVGQTYVLSSNRGEVAVIADTMAVVVCSESMVTALFLHEWLFCLSQCRQMGGLSAWACCSFLGWPRIFCAALKQFQKALGEMAAVTLRLFVPPSCRPGKSSAR